MKTRVAKTLNDTELDDYFTWVKVVWLTARGEPLDFEDHKYLVDIYRDNFPSIVYQKAAQMGFSERLISEAVWVCDRLNKNVLYTFPTSSQLNDFVQARLEPVFMQSDYLSRITGVLTSDEKKKRNIDEKDKVKKVGLKQIGKGFLYLRGSQNQQQIITVDADCIYLDERDRFVQEHVPYIDKRLLHSELKWRREASTPTFPGTGINEAYINSDQRVWMLTCDNCKLEQEIDFFFNIDFEKKKVVCRNCKKPIDRFKMGRWVVQNPANTEVHGYRISGILNPRRTIEELIDSYEKANASGISFLQQFYNQVLGIPYEAEGQKVLIGDLNACVGKHEMVTGGSGCYAGADVGNVIHVVISQKEGNKNKYLWIGTVKDFFGPTDSLEDLMKRFNIQVLVIDANPDTRKVRELIEKFPNKVYAAYYPMRKFNVQEYYIFDDFKAEVYLDRTISLDYLISEIQGQLIILPVNAKYIPEFYEHLTSSIRRTIMDERSGHTVAKWVPNGPDHFMHASCYNRVALLKGGVGQALLESYGEEHNSPDQLNPNNLWGIARWVKLQGERIF
ncbi:MAG: phage terminase large subunit family protein [Actinomycetota bacterium]